MHNREITHIVKTESSSKNQLVVRTKCTFCFHLTKTKKKKGFLRNQNAKARFETLTIQIL